MANIISLSVVILSCIVLVHAEPATAINSYPIIESNGFEYNSNIINNGAYMADKEGHRENMNFYGGGNSGHLLTNSRSQGNLEESLTSNSYNGFSPSSHNTDFSTYSNTGNRENLASNSYFANNAAQSSFGSYTSSNSNGDSTFKTYTHGNDQAGSDFNHFSINKHKNLSYMKFSDNLTGATSAGNYPELGTENSSFREEYSGDSFRNHASNDAGFTDGADQIYNREVSNLFNSPNNDYSYGKHKDNTLNIGGSNKFMNDVYSFHPETRYVRGNHGNMGRDYSSSMILSNPGNNPFGNIRGNSGGKLNKYNKYLGNGKLSTIKEGRPNNYFGGSLYLGKIAGGHKSKSSFMNSYPSTSSIAYSSIPNLHSSNSYADSPVLRRYRSNSYVPGHASSYSGYY
ncbi:putative uncharacterized protein DDB_G0282133 isoform X2 [Apis dorsata]|uniref:putative uncharacterized protein DDB_G0282133 isoform X2 n=1 Tax=Apis dorsata TaxID=7462 RepID=UPI0003DF4BBC|nr:putative uncharacterized protein DDB_G0282133 isoform X2 [Apis dorsata]